MADSSRGPVTRRDPRQKRSLNPLSRFNSWRDERFRRRQDDLRAYLEAASPIAIRATKLYETWREAVAEPVQDKQKVANETATFWWRVTQGLRRFETLTPPDTARHYHKVFAAALRNASIGTEAAKNGFRMGKTYNVSLGLGFLDEFVKQMDEAEKELGRLVLKYRLLEEPPLVDEAPWEEDPEAPPS